MKKLVWIACITLCLSSLTVFADQKPKALSTDSRMKVISYDANNVVTVVGSQLVQTSIQFGDDETIVGVEGGDAAAWTIDINKIKPNLLFVKPTVEASDTNLAVMTDKHLYQFHLMTNTIDTASTKEVTYNVRFRYPQVERDALVARLQAKQQLKDSVVTENPIDPMNVNWEYSFSSRCDKEFVPIKAFDDGKFTYFQFSANTQIPAIFVVDKQGKESLANSRMRGQYVVIERLARQFSLRNGKTVSCVFNDHFI